MELGHVSTIDLSAQTSAFDKSSNSAQWNRGRGGREKKTSDHERRTELIVEPVQSQKMGSPGQFGDIKRFVVADVAV